MEYIVYRKQVCLIKDLKDGIYHLVPVDDDSIKYSVPKDSNCLRGLITKAEIDALLKEIPSIDTINDNEKLMEQYYKELMSRGTHEDLIKIIKTTYLRNELRKMNKKKVSDKDNEYFNRAEKYLYNELGVVLNLDFDETKAYVENMVKKQANL